MKYLKKFNNSSDYESFKEGEEYVTPNVSLITDNNSVMFNPKVVEIINFKINFKGASLTKDYISEKNMTWEEWVNSNKYDINGPWGDIYIQKNESTSLVYGGGSSWYYQVQKPDGSTCTSTDIIEDNTTYIVKGELSGPPI